MSEQVPDALLNTAVRQTWIDLEGPLQGHKILARPPSGTESLRYADYVRDGNGSEAAVYILSQCILEWSLQYAGKELPVTAANIRKMSGMALIELQNAIDPLLEDLNEDLMRFFVRSSETSRKDTPDKPEQSAQTS